MFIFNFPPMLLGVIDYFIFCTLHTKNTLCQAFTTSKQAQDLHEVLGSISDYTNFGNWFTVYWLGILISSGFDFVILNNNFRFRS